MGQLIRFVSIYYAPLYLALGRPHTITVLALPYLLIQLFLNTEKKIFAYGSNNQNSIRDLENIFVFLNHLIFQLLNICILPSSTLARLVSIYLFRCNNKMLFVISSFFCLGNWTNFSHQLLGIFSSLDTEKFSNLDT
ncbi:unnamed protein product [Cuscuta epithymum]|uniref:Protein TIC 214 n=1 Tax=Cuscuta epithymum TaxID=186058 RepID=A0AAV0EBQ6_9ASTE|nr:unnamed protein product [Cuscuta epithymum]